MTLAAVDFVTIVNRATVPGKPADVWARIGGYFDLAEFLPVTCTAIAGDGNIGSVRQVNDNIVEPMVGQTSLSYTYAQTEGPMAPYDYHGCVACEPAGEGTAILYTLVYDQAAMTPEQRTSEQARISARFTGAVEAMAAAARG